MIVVTGEVHLAADESEEFAAGLEPLVTATRAEPGCVRYEFWRHRTEPGVFHVFEEWRDDEALDAHQHTDHYRAFVRALRTRTITHIEAIHYDVAARHRLR